MTHRSDARAGRDPASAARTASRRAAPGHGATADDRFFRHIVSSMRNGVLAIHRDGTLALMNDDAYRIFSLTKTSEDV
jgi:signal transduction histidine kinase